MENVILDQDISDAILHGIYVSNMAYEIGKEMRLSKDVLHELAIAGMLHDIGKLKLPENNQEKHNLVIEQLRYVRMHSQLSYEILRNKGYSQFVLKSILHHHENYDGSGYPDNIAGEDIPLGARILRICDVFIALTSDRAYRKAFDVNTAVSLMIDEVKNFDMKIFLAFLNVVNEIDIDKVIKNRETCIDNRED
jgi:putative nucleotidyltransferase with HDIG domain